MQARGPLTGAGRGTVLGLNAGPAVLSYGGGRQTVAVCVLVARGVLPRPDRIVMADTGRENASTWEYLDRYVRPLIASLGLEVEVAPHSLATVDLYAHNGDLLLPVYTADGKLPGFCSDEWKRRVVKRHLAAQGVQSGEMWIGFALDERRRVQRMSRNEDTRGFPPRFPLVELMLTTAGCIEVVKRAGLPEPPHSSCWMCPHKRNVEWLALTPVEFAAACDLDDDLRATDIENGGSGVYLHHSRMPLRTADLNVPESAPVVRQCGLGMCVV
jgi:hypothetical protein